MTANDKKQRGGKSLHNQLTPEQREQLAEWLTLQNLTYEDALELVQDQFGVKSSVGALRRFYASFAITWEYSRAAGDAEQFGSLMEGKYDAATIKRAKQLAFSMLTDRNPNVSAAKTLLKIVGDTAKQQLAEQRLELDKRKVELLEAKAALADSAKGISDDESLTPEQKAAQLRSLFGMG
jgi:hypothetical protein